MAKDQQEQLSLSEQLIVAQQKYTEALKGSTKEAELLAKQIQIIEASIGVEKAIEQKENLMQAAKYAADLNQRAQSHAALLQQNVAIEQAILDKKIAAGELTAQQIADEQQRINQLGEAAAATQRVGDATKGILATTLGVSDAWKGTFLGSLVAAEDGIEQVGKAIADTMNPANLLGSTLMKIQEATVKMVTEADTAISGFNEMSGAAGALDDQMYGAFESTNHLGVSMQDAAAITGALDQSMSSFRGMADSTQEALIGAAAEMTALGISGETAGRTLANLQTSLGMSSKEAMRTQRDMASAALAIGMAPSQMAEGFQKAMPVLAAYGKQAPEIFKRVAAAAKGLNVSMDTLLNMTSQMDTFEGAANSAGQLNTILGGPLLNSMDLLNASEDERIRLILQSVDASGRSWESMGKFERKALAAAAGITDMNEANNLFSGGLDGYDRMQEQMAANSDEQKKLEEAQAAGVAISEKLTAIMNQFAMAVMPLVDGIRWLLDGIMGLNSAMGGMLIPVLTGVIAVVWAWTYATKIAAAAEKMWMGMKATWVALFGASAAAKTTEAAANSAVGATAPVAAAGETLLGVMAAAATPAVGALALGMGLLALGIGLVAISIAAILWGFVYLIQLFMEAPMAALQAAGALVVLGIAVAALVGIFALLAPIAPAAAAAMIIIGIGMMFLAVPMLIFSASFMMLAAALSMLSGGAAGAMMAIAAALIPFAIALLFAAPAMLLAGILFAPAAILVGMGLMFLGIGVSLIADNAAALPGIGDAISGLAWGLLSAAFPLWIAGIMIGPAAILLGIGLFLLGMGVSKLVKHRRKMADLGDALSAFAWNIIGAAPVLYLAGVLIGPAALLLGIGFIFLGLGLKSMEGSGATMQEIASNIVPMAIALAIAAPYLLMAGMFMLMAGVPFMIGAIFIAIGMAILAGPLTQFAMAMAIIAPFASVLGAIAMGLLLLGFALPVFGFGLLLLGIFASLPFFDTGLDTLTKALYIFADAMSGIPTEKAVALGQIFQGLAQLTDMEEAAEGLRTFAWALFPLSWGLAALPSGEAMNAQATALTSFGQAVQQHMVPAAMALFVAAPLLFIASLFLFPAGILLGIALPLIAVGLWMLGVALEQIEPWFPAMATLSDPDVGILPVAMALFGAAIPMWIASLFLFPASILLGFALPIIGVAFMWLAMGLYWMEPALPTMTYLADPAIGLLPFAIMTFLAAPFLFFAGLWLLPASFMWYIAAMLLAPAMIWMGIAMPIFAAGLLTLVPLLPFLMVLAPIMYELGWGFMMLGIGINSLWDKVGGWWSDWEDFTGNLRWGLRRIGDGMYYMAQNAEGINATARLFEVLNTLDEELPDRMLMIAAAMHELAFSLKQLPETKAIALTATLDAFEGAIQAAIKLKPEQREGLADMVVRGERAATQARTSPIQANAERDEGFLDRLGGLFGGGTDTGGGSSRRVVLQINERVLGEVVVDLMRNRYDLRSR